MKKSELRHIYLGRQKAIPQGDRSAKSEAIAIHFFQKFDLSSIRYLHTFIPIDKFNEVDTRLIVAKLWREFPAIEIVVPRVDFEAGEMKSLKFAPDTELVRNVWNIDEPSHDELVETRLIDVVLVPGLCFDRSGHRVGYGKGFYDRFLKKCRPDCVKIGLSFFEPVDKIDDSHDGDVQLDFVVTPNGVYRSVPS